ncbi:MAG: STAS domain-containing protein [Chloroflexi bacterium]|nr:STAS domain-containing protein [Chloroflexota bacterium]
MKVVKIERDGVLVFTLDGRFDAYRAQGLREELLEAIERETSRVVVDLPMVSLVDSNGVSTLVTGMKRAREKGGDLRLVGLPPSVSIIFKITKLDRAFEVLPDVDSAVASFAD